jgi:hypothetical protein
MTAVVAENVIPLPTPTPDEIKSLRTQLAAVLEELAVIRRLSEDTDQRLRLLRQEFDHVQRRKSLWGK